MDRSTRACSRALQAFIIVSLAAGCGGGGAGGAQAGGARADLLLQGVELVQNGSFTAGLTGWDTWLQDGGDATFAATGGRAVVRVRTPASTDAGVQLHTHGLALEAGRTYRLRFRARAEVPAVIEAMVREHGVDLNGDGSPWSAYQYGTYAIGTEWAQLTADFTMPLRDPNAGVCFFLGQATGRVFLDDVSLVELIPPPMGTELVDNGDFGDRLRGWETWLQDGGVATFAARNGAAIVDVTTAAATPWGVQLHRGGVPLFAGRTYQLSFTAWASAPRTIDALVEENGRDVNGDGSAWSTYHRDTLALGTAPARLATTFTMTGTDAAAGVFFFLGQAAGRVTIDDVSLVEIPPPPPPPTFPFQLPPSVKSPRAYPRLVNYFHRMDYPEARIAGREDYLAQWDVIVLNPQNAADQGLDLGRIRAVNPGIKILAWIPFGQSSLDMDLSRWLLNSDRYFVKDVAGEPLQWSWGGYFMNPYVEDYAVPRQVVAYVTEHYLDPGTYDGVMLDCVWSSAPRSFWPTPKQVDVNGDGVDDAQDDADYAAGVEFLLSSLRAAAPGAIVTANPGEPWSYGTSYYSSVNGVMMENALGTEWRPADGLWDGQWSGYLRATSSAGAAPAYTFVVADLRDGGVTQEQARVADALTANDLRRFRLALGMTLLGDGCFGFDRGDGNHGQLWWFPEYDVDLGMPWPGFQAPASTWQYGEGGTLRREFQNATVIVNPGAEATQVAFVDERRDVATGQAGTAFALPARDARIYLRPCAPWACTMPEAAGP